MRKAVLIILAVIISCAMNAQELKVTSFELDIQDLEAKLNPVIDENGEPAALIRVMTPEKDMYFTGPVTGIPEFDGSEWTVYTKRGAGSLTLKVKGIPALNYRFKEVIEPSYVYVMQVDAVRPERYEILLVPEFSWHPSNTSYGIMAGAMKRFGAYLKVKSDFNRQQPYSGTCSGYGMLADGTTGWFTGESKKCRSSITAGALAHIKGPFIAYAGLGHGQRALFWENYDHTFSKVSTHSHEGVAAEAGLMVKAGRFVIAAGISETAGRWFESDFGVGIRF